MLNEIFTLSIDESEKESKKFVQEMEINRN